MRHPRIATGLLIVVLGLTGTAPAQKVGDTVVAISSDAAITVEGRTVEKLQRGATMGVRKVSGEMLAVFGTRAGWIQANHVATLDEAVKHFSAEIQRNPSDAEAYCARGEIHIQQQRYDQAVDDLNEAVRLRPTYARAYSSRGSAWAIQGESDKGFTDLDHAIRIDPNNTVAYLNRAFLWGRKKEPDKAIADFKNAISQNPDWAGSFLLRGTFWSNQGDWDKAISDFSEAIRLDPEMCEAYTMRGIVRHEKKGELDKAIADFDQAIRLNPKFALAYVHRGLAENKNNGDLDKAIADYREASRLNPSSTQPYASRFATIFFIRGIAWYKQSEHDKAIADFSEAIRLDPKYAAAFGFRGRSWCAKDAYDKAFADYAEAIRLEPDNANYYNFRGNTWNDKKEYDKAIADYNEAIRLDPRYANAYNDRGVAWAEKGERAKAIADYSEAIRLNPEYAVAYFNRGFSQKAQGEYDQAIADCNEAIRLDPNNATYYNSRGLAWDGKGEHDHAIADYSESIRLNPNSATYYNNRGLTWDDKREYDKAIADYSEAIRLYPEYATYYNNRGLAWDDKGEYDKAIADYSEAIRLNPQYAAAYNNRGVSWGYKRDYDKAIADYSESIRLDPDDAIVYRNRGLSWRVRGKFNNALADFSQAIQLDPTIAEAYRLRAWLLATCPKADLRDPELAIQDARKACKLTSRDASPQTRSELLDTLAAAYAANGDFDRAVSVQKEALQLGPPTEELAGYEARLVLYQSGKPYREDERKKASEGPAPKNDKKPVFSQTESMTAVKQPNKEITIDLGDGITMQFVLIPAGEFLMGSPDSDADAWNGEKPQHRVRISNPFYLGKYEVTEQQYRKITGSKGGSTLPQDSLTFSEAKTFCDELQIRREGTYRLPTEAEWEYACRAGSTTRFAFGDTLSSSDANFGSGEPMPVGSFRPNAWGLHDMHGNVKEWCQDEHADDYYANSPTDDPLCSGRGRDHVIRGGSYVGDAGSCRSAFRASPWNDGDAYGDEDFDHMGALEYATAVVKAQRGQGLRVVYVPEDSSQPVAVAQQPQSSTPKSTASPRHQPKQSTSDGWQVGQKVFARSPDDGLWYCGTIIKQRKGRFLILCADGDRGWTTAAGIRYENVQVGDGVYCNRRGKGTYYEAEVIAREGDQVIVRYENGKREDTTIDMLALEDGSTRKVEFAD